MAAPRVTLIVVPRERFSASLLSLDDIYRHTDVPFDLIYIDGGSPPKIARKLRQRAQQYSFRLLRSECYLSPNEARALGLMQVSTEYVVFIDNDVVVRPGWLSALMACSDQTGAWASCPTICWGPLSNDMPEFERVHFAGGTASIQDNGGNRCFSENNPHLDHRLPEIQDKLVRTRCTLLEFHCLLVRREIFDRFGPPDIGLFSTREHLDFGMMIEQAGGEIWYEPAAVVSYVLTPRFTRHDIAYYLLRWSRAWNHATLAHLNLKWRLDDNYMEFERTWLRPHRMVPLRRLRRLACALAGGVGERAMDRLEAAIAARGMRHRAAAGYVSPA